MDSRVMIVLEGSAGSGKSTLAARLVRDGLGELAVMPAIIERPRAYTGYSGLLLSSVKDYMASLAVVGHQSSFPVIVDRWVISNWVYSQIRLRQEGVMLMPSVKVDHLYRSLVSSFRLLRQAREEIISRSFGIPNEVWDDVRPQHIIFVFVMPRPDVIQRYRDQTPTRTFPYDVQEEASLYQYAATILSGTPSWNTEFPSITVHPFRYIPEEPYNYDDAVHHLGDIIQQKIVAHWNTDTLTRSST